jgi:peptidyl-prolyl cis-trans isomerase SurA
MINLRFLMPYSALALVFMLALQGSAWAQLRITKDFTKTSKALGASTVMVDTGTGQPPKPVISAQEQQSLDFIVVIVNSEPITRNEIAIKQARLMAQWEAQGLRPPAESEIYKRVLDRAIEERALLQAAKENGVRVSDDQLNEALLGIARQNQIASIALLRNKYEADGGSWHSYTEEMRNELVLLQAKEREVDAKVRISESEIDAALRTQNAAASGRLATQELNLAQILIAVPENPTEEQLTQAQQKATQIANKARAGEDFTQLAIQNSDATDKATGGVMGLRNAERYPELFVQIVKSLKVGEISAPTKSDAGFHVLKLIARKDSIQAMMTQSRVRHILLPVSKELSEAQAKNRIRAFKNQIELKQNTFAALAKDHSTDGSAAQGGDLGWTAPGVFVPEFEAVMNALAIGQLSEPLVSRFGVHLIEVTDRKEMAIPEREQREQIKAQLRERKAAEAYGLWVAETRNRAYVEYRNELRP